MPPRLLSPLADAIVLAVLLLVSAALHMRGLLARRGRLEEDGMPDWQRRDLGLLDGRDRRPCPPAERHGGW